MDFNKLDEVAAFFIPPECVIGAIGPVAAFDDEAYLLVIQDPQVLMNGNCRLGDEVRTAASDALVPLRLASSGTEDSQKQWPLPLDRAAAVAKQLRA